MNYFSDREGKHKAKQTDKIGIDVWNGIYSVYQKYSIKNCFSESFPTLCPDFNTPCGFDIELFKSRLYSEIPTIRFEKIATDDPLHTGNIIIEVEDIIELDSYSILDFMEFCYKHLKKPIRIGNYHSFYSHHHFYFEDSIELKNEFKEEINTILKRNGLIYFLNDQGIIERTIPLVLQKLTDLSTLETTDATINELLSIAIINIRSPKIDNRRIALEKLWDAFERIKTVYNPSVDKRQSINELINQISKGNAKISDLLTAETTDLTKTGNSLQIRHFEIDRSEINESSHIDYLFFRLLSLINILCPELK
jgi:hypothetical protein